MVKAISLNKNISLSLLEQLSLNLGNFLFFIFAARLVGPEQFGLFAVLIIGAQIVLSIAIQWIFLPITSKNIDCTNNNIIKNALTKIFVLAVFSPLFIWLYSYLLSGNNFDLWQYFLIYILALSMIGSDASRYYLIRIRKVKVLLISNTAKWAMAFVLLFMLIDNYENKYLVVLNIFSLVIFFGMLIQLFTIWLSRGDENPNDLSDQGISGDNPLLNLGLANVFNTIAITLLFNKVNIVAFGALQAFRSMVNIFPFFLQFLETHYSAIMVSKRQSKFIKIKWLITYTGLVILLSVFLKFFAINIIGMIYGDEYSKFDVLFLLLFIIVCIQSLSRLLSVQLRLQENYRAFNLSAAILWAISIILFYILYMLEIRLDYIDLLVIMLITAVMQLMSFIYYSYRRD